MFSFTKQGAGREWEPILLYVAVRGHPRDIPGVSVDIWILGYNGCYVLVAGKVCPQQSLFFCSVFPFFSVRVNVSSYFASTRVADSLEWYICMLASS